MEHADRRDGLTACRAGDRVRGADRAGHRTSLAGRRGELLRTAGPATTITALPPNGAARRSGMTVATAAGMVANQARTTGSGTLMAIIQATAAKA